jgi:hypothetical protein
MMTDVAPGEYEAVNDSPASGVKLLRAYGS